ncbi:hypothetical protein [Streptomyces sp. NPDC058394]|uniref:hypothetical protein n=1 Tax=Streptomyces sp. NPDC058394 TaxID=3346477 RepID=UPI0036467B82
MNRNTKHPGRTYRRKANSGDRTRNATNWRITASWDARPDRPAIRTTSDKHARNRMMQAFADAGAYVVLEEYRGHGQWRFLREIDGQAEAADRDRADREQREAAAREARHAADYAAQCEQNARALDRQAEAQLDDLARIMCRPPVARAAVGHPVARHVTGAQR